MNPILPRKYHVPDVEAHVMPDGRLYLYGSLDISGSSSYCCNEYRVFSTSSPKLDDWVDHGISFRNTKEEPGVPWQPGVSLYAPDAIYANGKYYLFFCGESAYEGVAESDRPEGPFKSARPIRIADRDSIDPAIFLDDDGELYYLWGQFNLRVAKLTKDMQIDESTLVNAILTEQEHGFHEGASLRKRNGKYYIVYTDISRGKATCLSYAMADHPLGPYKKGGVIIDNIYCDPSTWNNHGSIEEFYGQWYVFYHRSSQNTIVNRRVCVEPISFNEDGTINEVCMTSQGASDPINAFDTIDASIACRLKGNAYIKSVSEDKEILANCGGGNWTYDWAEYKYLNFCMGARGFAISASGKGKILVMTENRNILGSVNIDSEDFRDYKCNINTIEGIKPIWLLFDGRNMQVETFAFLK